MDEIWQELNNTTWTIYENGNEHSYIFFENKENKKICILQSYAKGLDGYEAELFYISYIEENKNTIHLHVHKTIVLNPNAGLFSLNKDDFSHNKFYTKTNKLILFNKYGQIDPKIIKSKDFDVKKLDEYPTLTKPTKQQAIQKAEKFTFQEIKGVAKNAAYAACVIKNNEPYYLHDLPYWDDKLLDKEIIVKGYVSIENIKEDDIEESEIVKHNLSGNYNIIYYYEILQPTDILQVIVKEFPYSKKFDKTQIITTNDTQKALTAIYQYLLKHNLKDSKKRLIYNNWKNYKVQFFGVSYADNKKLIYCNFVPKDEEFENWETKEIKVKDGGFWYWQVEYDIENDKVQSFRVNGEA
jgi:hypothetical protein